MEGCEPGGSEASKEVMATVWERDGAQPVEVSTGMYRRHRWGGISGAGLMIWVDLALAWFLKTLGNICGRIN